MDTEESRRSDAPPVTREHHDEAKRVMQAYDDDRPTVTLPGSGGTVSGTVVSDWVDDDGNPIYGNDSAKDE